MDADYIIVDESINFEYKKIPIEKRKHGRAYRLRPSKSHRSIMVDKHGYAYFGSSFKVMEWVPYGTIRKMSNYMDKPFNIWYWNKL